MVAAACSSRAGSAPARTAVSMRATTTGQTGSVRIRSASSVPSTSVSAADQGGRIPTRPALAVRIGAWGAEVLLQPRPQHGGGVFGGQRPDVEGVGEQPGDGQAGVVGEGEPGGDDGPHRINRGVVARSAADGDAERGEVALPAGVAVAGVAGVLRGPVGQVVVAAAQRDRGWPVGCRRGRGRCRGWSGRRASGRARRAGRGGRGRAAPSRARWPGSRRGPGASRRVTRSVTRRSHSAR